MNGKTTFSSTDLPGSGMKHCSQVLDVMKV